MAGRIRDEDVALVKEKARLDEVVSQYVTLRPAGGGSEKGLCPFHDEKSPSFNVTQSRGFYYCFGCQASGDVITFVQEMEGLDFGAAVERLADRYGVQLRFEEPTGSTRARRDPHQRMRLIEANRAAAAFYVEQLSSSEDAVTGRRFLDERGFGREVADRFTIGFAPRSGEALLSYLTGRGFRSEELVAAGLAGRNERGAYDRFRGRLLWPIRDLSGEVVGFGARRLFDDDRIEAKYLNTPETPLYKKSTVLYGLDRARRAIGHSMQAVIVEGYTDVMACHESGVETAVATCGTAFGDEHARILRRLLADHDEFRGEVVFTFDGDAAGQRAALKAFEGDQQFVAQTYVAVEPEGRDPAELRLAEGDAAVRELIARRVPLYRFVLRNVVDRYDLDRADHRVNAMREAARLVSSVRDRSKVDAFARELAGMVGLDVDEVSREVRKASSLGGRAQRGRSRPADPTGAPADPSAVPVPDVRAPRFSDERETLKAVLQFPQLVGDAGASVDVDDFTHPWLAAVWAAVETETWESVGGAGWTSRVLDHVEDPLARAVARSLTVEPLHVQGDPGPEVVGALLARLQEVSTVRRVETLRSRLQRTNPIEQVGEYNRLFGELLALEAQRRALRDRALGGA
ncbi:MAG: DNA primase [Actinomycetota bacterium]|nr:DNA primase [Actinomycetota bacterium]